MKKNWTYKKLGEVATYVNGFAFKPEHWGNEGIPIIRIQNLNNEGADYNYSNVEIPSKYIINNGDILISWSASLGVYEWYRGKAYLNQHIFKVLFDKININKNFFKYAVSSKLKEMIKNAHGATMKHVVKGDFDNTPIPLPPLPIQEKIVSELDCINGILDNKRQQLKELDALAQSLFYQMFGDPINNEKGWEVKKLGDCLSYIKNGANIKQAKGASGYPITRIETLSGGLFNRDRMGYADIFSTEKYTSYIMREGDILMSHINSKTYVGRAVIYKKRENEQIIHGMNLLLLRVILSLLSPMYLNFYFKTNYFRDKVAQNRKDAVNQSSISMSDLKRIPVMLPPLPLQQSFAAKIEAIEKQKALIKQSIADMETLLASRMQYWFD